MISKVKALRTKFRVALDSGRRSGGGRVVAQFYDLCSNIWGGSPAAESVPCGLETSDSPLSASSSLATEDGDEADIDLETSEEGNQTLDLPTPKGITGDGLPKRSLIEHLKDSRDAKLKKPIPFEKQILQVTRDDMSFKKQMLQEMKEANKSHAAQMNILTSSLVNLTNALTAALNQPLHVPQPQPQFFQSPVQNGNYSFLGQSQDIQLQQMVNRKKQVVNFIASDDEQNFVEL